MTIKELIESGRFVTVCMGDDINRRIEDVFCCDLLSVAMGRGVEGAAWVTVMGNVNTLAVLTLTDMACIILAEGADLDEAARIKAAEQRITVLRTEEPVFKAALWIHDNL